MNVKYTACILYKGRLDIRLAVARSGIWNWCQAWTWICGFRVLVLLIFETAALELLHKDTEEEMWDVAGWSKASSYTSGLTDPCIRFLPGILPHLCESVWIRARAWTFYGNWRNSNWRFGNQFESICSRNPRFCSPVGHRCPCRSLAPRPCTRSSVLFSHECRHTAFSLQRLWASRTRRPDVGPRPCPTIWLRSVALKGTRGSITTNVQLARSSHERCDAPSKHIKACACLAHRPGNCVLLLSWYHRSMVPQSEVKCAQSLKNMRVGTSKPCCHS